MTMYAGGSFFSWTQCRPHSSPSVITEIHLKNLIPHSNGALVYQAKNKSVIFILFNTIQQYDRLMDIGQRDNSGS